MKFPCTCNGCDRSIGSEDSAIHVEHVDGDLVTTWHLCEPCLVRCHNDDAFAAKCGRIVDLLQAELKA
jgi:hypothetical protein